MALATEPPRTEETPRNRPRASQILSILGIVSAIATLLLGLGGALQEHPVFEVGRVVFGNIPYAVEVVFYVTTATFIWLMFHLFARRAVSWEQGRSDPRVGQL